MTAQHITFIKATVLACAVPLFQGPAIASTEDSTELDNIKIIDVHTHVFNARDLPLIGILQSRGIPLGTATIVESILVRHTPMDEDQGIAVPSRKELAARVNTPIFSLTASERDSLRIELGRTSLRENRNDAELIAEIFQKADFPPDEHSGAARLQNTHDAAGLSGYMRFLGVVTLSPANVRRYLAEAEFPAVDLFLHHMMDLEKAYASTPARKFDEQIEVTDALDAAAEKMIFFSAFDPFRREDALSMAEKAWVDGGALGIKFYPPSGYRPTGNEIPRKPWIFARFGRKQWKSQYSGLTGRKLDEYNDAFFAWAAKNDVPVFTHCTPFGFQAKQGYGLNADPLYWEIVLKKYPKLRLCFGHGGGEDYWFSDREDENPEKTITHDKPSQDAWRYGKKITELVLKYPNVYFEVGYLHSVVDHVKAEALSRRLEATLSKRSENGEYQLGERIMYGSDWYMMIREDGHHDYLTSFDRVIQSVDEGRWRKAFFAENAIRFLRLRHRSSIADRPGVKAVLESLAAQQ